MTLRRCWCEPKITQHSEEESGDTTEDYPQPVQQFKSFVYAKARWVDSAKEPELEVEVEVVERANGRPLCSGSLLPVLQRAYRHAEHGSELGLRQTEA